jgi:hypothetical protein
MKAVVLAAVWIALPAWAANPLEGIFGPENLKKAQVEGVKVEPGGRPDTLLLRFPASETPGSLTVPVPPAAADWSSCGAFTFEFASSSTIRWEMQIRNRRGQTFTYRVQPYQDVPAKAAISNAFLTREYMNNRQYKAHWLSSWANHIDLTQVASIAIRMAPNREVTLRLGPLALEPHEAADEFRLGRPVVDAFGQWIGLEWPGKVRAAADLARLWAAEDAALEKAERFAVSEYGGWSERRVKATGFFRTVQNGGRWWLVDPAGHLFFSAGPDCVRYANSTLVTGREALFAKLPPGSAETADFYQANARQRHGEADFVNKWKAHQARRLRAWGFNTVANWSDAGLFDGPAVPFVTTVSVDRGGRAWQGFPDVYSEAFAAEAAQQAARQCARFRDEPRLIGYFIGNEPRWPGRNLIDLILRDKDPSATQAFVRKFLDQRGDTPAAREALMEALSRRYFTAVCGAIRKADPNHMILGIRWAGNAPDPVLKANDVFDVFSLNIYAFEPPADRIERIHALTKRPILIGEFHFGAPERGYAPSLVMVKDQTERGAAYQYYLERAAAFPQVVGAHWFQFADQPVTGRFDGENYNIGFVNQLDVPYPELVKFAQAAHRRMYRVHAGEESPVSRRAVR